MSNVNVTQSKTTHIGMQSKKNLFKLTTRLLIKSKDAFAECESLEEHRPLPGNLVLNLVLVLVLSCNREESFKKNPGSRW